MAAYYNEINTYCADWLLILMKKGLIADGEVDTRSIKEVRIEDIKGFTQCHFFAGLGGWGRALRIAGVPDTEPLWTGSCPCQPFSVAGKKKGFEDERHLWPVWANLIRVGRPAIIFGEQVAAASDWFRLVRSDLEAMEYAVGAASIEAASAGAYHLRDRLWFVAHTLRTRSQGRQIQSECIDQRPVRSDGVALIVVEGPDGKRRLVESGIRLLAHGVPKRVAKLRAFGNAIDPRPAAVFVTAALDAISLGP